MTFDVLSAALGALAALLAVTLWRRAGGARVTPAREVHVEPATPAAATPPPGLEVRDGTDADTPSAPARPEPERAEPAAASPPPTLEAVAESIRPAYDAAGHPRDLDRSPEFVQAVRFLADARFSVEDLVAHCIGANPQLAVAAAAALATREDSAAAVDAVLEHLPHAYVWTTYHALRFVDARATAPVACRVLLVTPEWWLQNPLMPRILSDFVAARAAKGEQLDLGSLLGGHTPASLANVRAMLAKLSTPLAAALERQVDEWLARRVDREYLLSVGRIVDGSREGRAPTAHPRLQDAAASVFAGVLQTPPRSFAVVGDTGVGKSTVLRVAAAGLTREGWTVFEAGAGDILAGMVYMGELEGRVKRLLAEVDVARRIVWIVPAFAELAHAGRHRYSTTSVLDLLLPALETGRLVMLAEEEPETYERLLQARPRLRSLVRMVRLEPMAAPDALALAREMAAGEIARAGLAVVPGTMEEAVELATQYLPNRRLPGSLVELLRATARRLSANGAGTLDRLALVATLAELTGLPRALLDERESLDPTALRRHFEARVMGQPEAVSCLVDRVAMLKAGLTDPRRPIGVFLFAGPTGTGKTEVAKTLAEFLFGHADRMLRVDMSELQDAHALGRIVGEGGEGDGESLASRIRRQPFSVVLLDEFEKAHPRIWDLFLQVFDDGRLTDPRGVSADFRHAIVILTSNLGATAHAAARVGFTGGAGGFGEAQVLRAIGEWFRPELVNRLDRVVVFRPLGRGVMRDILRKELRDVLGRRGFRTREWAVEWEESAIELLLDKGFTPDMGARPLRRAIEQYVLAPIAMTIVEHRFPEGDQFLFVRAAGDALEVEFVDPAADLAPDTVAEAAAPESAPPEDGDAMLRRLALAPSLDPAARARLASALGALETHVAAEAWVARKGALMTRINRTEFWSEPDHRTVLDTIERMDRVAASIDTARSLERRLQPMRRATTRPPASIVASLAQQLYLLEAEVADLEAGVAGDVWLAVERIGDDGPAHAGDAWAGRVAAMYAAWGRKRHMRVVALQEAPPRHVYAIGGSGVHRILAPESGLHVLEGPEGGEDPRRCTARVRVLAQPVSAARARDAELAAANAAFALAGGAPMAVVRRYRERPSPLVRDALAGWRSGRLDLILGGDFDLVA